MGGQKIATKTGAGAVNRLRFANTDNSRLALASSDGTISICSARPGGERGVLHVLFGGHEPASPITDVVWSFANDLLVSTALDGSVCLWDTEGGNLRRMYPASSVDVGPVLVCAFQPLNYNLLVVGGAWGRIQTLNLSTGKLIKKGRDQVHSTGYRTTKSMSLDSVKCTGQGCILALTFDQGSGTILWVGTDRGVIQSYSCQPATGHLTRCHHAPVLDVAIGWDETVLASADESGSVILWRHEELLPDHY
ncbi:unnamed protein product [Echinostoma caproni]|uniref:WD_REPEATS_REGION domain-containing protein n=1 Tax=Echinostoma caproni TaxID=27848 RepID=A0A183B497_9TREM|nr:unnamed protein product [Echinostoma caproni]